LYVTAIVLIDTALAAWLHRAQASPSTLYSGVFAQTATGLYALGILTRLSLVNTWCLPVFGTDTRNRFFTTTETNSTAGAIALVTIPIGLFLAVPFLLWLLLAQTVTLTKDAKYILNIFPTVLLWVCLLVIPVLYGLAVWSFIRRPRENRR
jgi:hypothetical protein